MTNVDFEKLKQVGRDLLVAIGEDPDRPALRDTPRRFANMWQEFIDYDPGRWDTTFEHVQNTDQMVVVSGIRVWSMCEHHLLPFWCDVSIAYIPREEVLGLSKFARIAHLCAHKPQIQEGLVRDIANKISIITGTDDVAVLAKGVHLCMSSRGVRSDAVMTSSAMHGIFRDSASTRSEFLALI